MRQQWLTNHTEILLPQDEVVEISLSLIRLVSFYFNIIVMKMDMVMFILHYGDFTYLSIPTKLLVK